MQSAKKDFSLMERMALVAIILIVSAIGIQTVLESIQESEERALNAASAEYSTIRKMYAEPYHAHYSDVASTNPNGVYISQNKPVE